MPRDARGSDRRPRLPKIGRRAAGCPATARATVWSPDSPTRRPHLRRAAAGRVPWLRERRPAGPRHTAVSRRPPGRPADRPALRRAGGPVCGVWSSRPRPAPVANLRRRWGAANVHLGPGAVTFIVLLHKHVGVSLEKIATLLRERFGLTVTPGGLVQALHRAARVAAPSYDDHESAEPSAGPRACRPSSPRPARWRRLNGLDPVPAAQRARRIAKM